MLNRREIIGCAAGRLGGCAAARPLLRSAHPRLSIQLEGGLGDLARMIS